MPRKPSKRPRCPIDVFKYHDYRAFLAAYYEHKKPQGFSYRAFSRAAKLGAPNYLQLVIQGRRKLTSEMARRFAETCGLASDAAEYFMTRSPSIRRRTTTRATNIINTERLSPRHAWRPNAHGTESSY